MFKKIRIFKIMLIKVLAILLFISAVADFGSYALVKMGKSNLSVSNIYFVVQFFLLSYIYYLLPNNKKIIYIALIFFTVFYIINTLFIQPITIDQNWSNFVGGVLIFIYSMSYYLKLLDNMPTTNIFSFHLFWFNTAIFYYFGASVLIFLCIDFVLKNIPADEGIIIWGFHNFNNIIKNILFAVAIYYVKTEQSEDPNNETTPDAIKNQS
ncbi:MAG: hypothetical protein IPJ81_05245 [Chitinophagaceae bacterium]|nr:hypothetical protein [Chitinophagaceae bacterium]